ncbi:PIN domain-like protein [Dipodascopsis uninucleata]
MGINGLLPLLKSIHEQSHIKQFSGKVVAIDGYVWLHRGAFACAADLAYGKPTSRYVDYIMNRIKMLKHYGVRPYLVFDGANLPSKQYTEAERLKSRTEAKEMALKLANCGKWKQAQEYFQKSIDITPVMAANVFKTLQREGIPFVVAPYEADAQLAYLEKCGLVSAIISEDSDLLVFGCNCLITKLNDYGECVIINRSRIAACKDINLTSFSNDLFRHMVILAGCDYTPGIPNIGLKKAHMYLNRYGTAEKAIKFMRLEGKIRVPPNFEKDFERADLTFQYQRVFCPLRNRLVMWNEPSKPLPEIMDHYIGRDIDQNTSVAIASGKLDPITHDPYTNIIYNSDISKKVDNKTGVQSVHSSKPITAYFKKSSKLVDLPTRQPLGDISNAITSSIEPNSNLSGSESFETGNTIMRKRLRLLSSEYNNDDPESTERENHSPFFTTRSSVNNSSDSLISLSDYSYLDSEPSTRAIIQEKEYKNSFAPAPSTVLGKRSRSLPSSFFLPSRPSGNDNVQEFAPGNERYESDIPHSALINITRESGLITRLRVPLSSENRYSVAAIRSKSFSECPKYFDSPYNAVVSQGINQSILSKSSQMSSRNQTQTTNITRSSPTPTSSTAAPSLTSSHLSSHTTSFQTSLDRFRYKD